MLAERGSCTQELTVVMAACRKPVQAQTRPNASMDRRVGHTVLPLAVELLGTVSCWKRESRFVLIV